ncbi:MAG: hypothetical protein Q8K75_08155 [Chlamydiales bacterium]|nr:hypothetical protein [Chlamydiales bacterium]
MDRFNADGFTKSKAWGVVKPESLSEAQRIAELMHHANSGRIHDFSKDQIDRIINIFKAIGQYAGTILASDTFQSAEAYDSIMALHDNNVIQQIMLNPEDDQLFSFKCVLEIQQEVFPNVTRTPTSRQRQIDADRIINMLRGEIQDFEGLYKPEMEAQIGELLEIIKRLSSSGSLSREDQIRLTQLSSQHAALNEQLNARKATNEEQKHEIDRLQQERLREAQPRSLFASEQQLQGRIRELENSLRTEQEKLRLLDTQSRSMDFKQSGLIERLNEKITEIERELGSTHDELVQVKKENAIQFQTIQELRQQLNNAKVAKPEHAKYSSWGSAEEAQARTERDLEQLRLDFKKYELKTVLYFSGLEHEIRELLKAGLISKLKAEELLAKVAEAQPAKVPAPINEELSPLQQSMQQLEQLHASMREQENTIRILHGQIKGLSLENNELMSTNSGLQQVQQQLNSQIQELRGDLTKLNSKARSQAAFGDPAQLASNLERTRKEVAQLTKEKASIEQELESNKVFNKVSLQQTQKRVDELQTENEALQTTIREQQVSLSELNTRLAESRAQLEQKEQELSQVQNQNVSEKDTLESFRELVKKQSKELADKEEELNIATASLQSSNEALEKAQRDLRDTKELDEVKLQLEAALKAVNEKQEQVESLDRHIGSLAGVTHQQWDDMGRFQKSLEKQLQQANTKISELESTGIKSEKQQRELEETRQQVTQLTRELEMLRTEGTQRNDQASELLTTKEAELEQVKQKLEVANTELKQSQSELQQAQQRFEELQTAHHSSSEELATKLTRLEQQLADKQLELKESESKVEGLELTLEMSATDQQQKTQQLEEQLTQLSELAELITKFNNRELSEELLNGDSEHVDNIELREQLRTYKSMPHCKPWVKATLQADADNISRVREGLRLEKELAEIKEAGLELNALYEQLLEDHNQLQETAEQLEQELKASEKNRLSAAANFAAASTANAQLLIDISKLNRSVSEKEADLRTKDAELHNFSRQLDQTNADLQRAQNEQERLRTELESTNERSTSEIASLEGQLTQAQKAAMKHEQQLLGLKKQLHSWINTLAKGSMFGEIKSLDEDLLDEDSMLGETSLLIDLSTIEGIPELVNDLDSFIESNQRTLESSLGSSNSLNGADKTVSLKTFEASEKAYIEAQQLLTNANKLITKQEKALTDVKMELDFLKDVEATNTQLTEKLNHLRREKKKVTDRATELEKELHAKTLELSKLQDATPKTTSPRTLKAKEDESALLELSQKYNDLKRQHGDAQKYVERLNSEILQMRETSESEGQLIEATIQTKQAAVLSRDQALEDVKTLRTEIAVLEEKLRIADEHQQLFEKTLEGLYQSKETFSPQEMATFGTVKYERDELLTEVEKHKENQAKIEVFTQELNRRHEQNAEQLKQQISQLQGELESVNNQLEAVQQLEAGVLKKQVDELKHQASVNKAVHEAHKQAHANSLVKMQEQLHEAGQMGLQLVQENGELKESLQFVEKVVKDQANEMQHYAKIDREQRAENAELKVENAQLKDQNAELLRQLAEMQARLNGDATGITKEESA